MDRLDGAEGNVLCFDSVWMRDVVGDWASGEGVSEVEGGYLEKVDGKGDFGEDKVPTSPEHNVGKVEKVEEDEMRPNTACCLHPNLIIYKQMPHIS